MAIKDLPGAQTTTSGKNLVEMSWDPITRIVGSLGIYTKIDFKEKVVAECHSTSSIFRGYSIFMKGKDPRDAHFITSRICGICGDNHCVCAIYAQNMAFGVRPPALGEWITNLGEAAEYMFDHNIFQENLVGVDFCEQMVRETNPSVWEKAKNKPAPNAHIHGYKTIADIMTALNPFTGDFYRQALVISRYTREMFCLMEGKHVHPSTLYPGGTGTVATNQLFTDYYSRLMRYIEYMKVCVPLHDDLFDFFYEALPGYEKVGQRRILLGCWGAFQDPDHCDFQYRNMTHWGRKMFVTPGVVVDGKLVTNDLVQINLGIRILLGHSYYNDWENEETFMEKDPLGNPVDRRHPWNQTTLPTPKKRNFDGQYSWVMSPRWYDGKDHLALDTGGGALARMWSTALSGLVDIGYVKATGNSVIINLPKSVLSGPVTFEWKCPKWSNAIERDRARTYFQAYSAGRRCSSSTRPSRNCAADAPGRGNRSRFPRRLRLRLHGSRARRALAPRDHSRRQDRELSSLPADSLERKPARQVRHARTLRRRRAEHADLRRERARIRSRGSTSCAPCAASIRASRAACTCISETGTIETMHSPLAPFG
jgi:hydrogenase large subunit